jgi:hypothetical protein
MQYIQYKGKRGAQVLRGRHHAPRRRLRGRRRRRAPRRAPPAHRAQIRCECTAAPRARARATASTVPARRRSLLQLYAACAQQRMHSAHAAERHDRSPHLWRVQRPKRSRSGNPKVRGGYRPMLPTTQSDGVVMTTNNPATVAAALSSQMMLHLCAPTRERRRS